MGRRVRIGRRLAARLDRIGRGQCLGARERSELLAVLAGAIADIEAAERDEVDRLEQAARRRGVLERRCAAWQLRAERALAAGDRTAARRSAETKLCLELRRLGMREAEQEALVELRRLAADRRRLRQGAEGIEVQGAGARRQRPSPAPAAGDAAARCLQRVDDAFARLEARIVSLERQLSPPPPVRSGGGSAPPALEAELERLRRRVGEG